MKNKNNRHKIIREIISTSSVGSQEDLLKVLIEQGFSLTQATLSRDLKSMKVVKQATELGNYQYVLPTATGFVELRETKRKLDSTFAEKGFLSVDFSGNMAVLKTKPGYAAGIASDIDAQQQTEILGSIAGDDTILLIIREGVTRHTVLEILSSMIPTIKG